MSNWFKRNGIHFAIFGIFLAICFFYFTPAFQGKALNQGDVLRAQSTQKEIMDVKDKTGKSPLWTNSMFSGMPAFQVWVPFPSNVTTYVVNTLKTVFPNPVDTVLLLLLGTYFLLSVLKLNPWLAAAGAIAFAFSSYNFILIDAGHANQVYAIAFFCAHHCQYTHYVKRTIPVRCRPYRIFSGYGNSLQPHSNDLLFVAGLNYLRLY
jgi:hypothetical protein